MRVKPTKFNNVFAATEDEMYPGEVCLYTFTGSFFMYVAAGSWSDPTRDA